MLVNFGSFLPQRLFESAETVEFLRTRTGPSVRARQRLLIAGKVSEDPEGQDEVELILAQ